MIDARGLIRTKLKKTQPVGARKISKPPFGKHEYGKSTRQNRHNPR